MRRLHLSVSGISILLALSLAAWEYYFFWYGGTHALGSLEGRLGWFTANRLGYGGFQVGLAAMILAGFYWPLVYWTLEGMEVGLLALIVTLAATALITGKRPVVTYALLGAGTFVRTDFLVVLLAFALAGAVLDDPQRRRAHLTLGLVVAIAAATLQTGARLLYFHDPLPNTYYLKLTGIESQRR